MNPNFSDGLLSAVTAVLALLEVLLSNEEKSWLASQLSRGVARLEELKASSIREVRESRSGKWILILTAYIGVTILVDIAVDMAAPGTLSGGVFFVALLMKVIAVMAASVLAILLVFTVASYAAIPVLVVLERLVKRISASAKPLLALSLIIGVIAAILKIAGG